ncbi:type VI secretion system-associated protein [Snodgrassella alvi]|uniref:Type VI secretion system baseplate subunit TssK n=1 Tax=Snodgrassella alvi TaxID=1196083 RepID=A0ABD7Z2J5_9NEIS|nr:MULTISPECIES: type VI secretion system baseplate subunit TssK [Snodgrassella]AHN27490.1 tssK [Snodgrassella alvi wkB2]MBI0068741.1 type VI secretion system baseplate subunit TssK [Snodgrassella sp. M0110]MBI0077719.1 type VI secretion system baseplate subunit TssK [Snodgrassella sp. M0118]MBI0080079.1 type VI secretion system baseplate subunit TssK [Snodgrassella sp. M0112]MBI0159593.1 type VI secretion system baseplate subunit TssK [Snodgrassella sp. W6238H11]
MSWYNRVVWSEGQFLLPQIFQQQERYLEHFAHRRSAPLSPFFWGFSRYDIDHEALNLGKLVLKDVAGVFADGTPFEAPGNTPLPPPLTIQPEHLDQIIYLALPIRTPNGEETSFEDNPESLARYAVFESDVRDANSIGLGAKTVQLSNLRLRLMPKKALTDAWIGLPIARISTLRSDGGVEIDSTVIPPVTQYTANTLLQTWLSQIHDLTHLRADSLAERLTGGHGKGAEAAEVSDYLLLQILNRYEPLLFHILKVGATSPEFIYRQLLSMAGELSTFVRPHTRRPVEHPPYLHEAPYYCLKPVVDDVQHLLNAVLIRSAQHIRLEDAAYGVKNAVVEPTELRGFGSMVLAVKAQIPPDILVHQFSAQTKIGPSDRLPELIRSHLPGMVLQALPVPPRQIPFNAGYVYFELLREGPLWEHIAHYGGLAMHIAGDFPGLLIELWGVRDQ